MLVVVPASMTPGKGTGRVDAYVVLQLPDGQLMSWTRTGFVPGLVPYARNMKPVNYRAVIARLKIPAGVPAGTYTWFSALAAAGTLDLVSDIAAEYFTIRP